MSLNGMAESRRLWRHRRVWLKCSKTVARELQVLPVCACRWFNRATKKTRQAQAPSPVFFSEAPGRPVFPSSLSPPDTRGWRARGRCRRRFKIRISLRKCGSASRRATRTSLKCPGSFAVVFFRFAHSRKRNVCAGPRFPGTVLIGGFPRSEVASRPYRVCRHF
jgi:hypothetical protein